MSYLELRNVNKRYGAHHIIKDVSLSIEQGEFVVFVGPSGCGKSTLLRMIAGLIDIDSGSVHLDGRDITHVSSGSRDLAMVFQSYALYPHMSVQDNMSFALRLANVDKTIIQEKVSQAAKVLNLTQYLDRTPKDLSGGQRQRVAIGRAIVREPKVFLFDEPLSNLDAALRGQTRIEIANLHRQLGATTIYVTHDQVEAMTLADRVVVLRDGVIEQMGAPLELYDNPANQFVAQFIGTPAMNFVKTANNADLAAVLGALAPVAGSWGVRPEAVRLCPAQTGHATGEVMLIESLGSDTLVYIRLPAPAGSTQTETTLTARLRERTTLKVGDTTGLELDTQAVHSFDAQGQRIARG